MADPIDHKLAAILSAERRMDYRIGVHMGDIATEGDLSLFAGRADVRTPPYLGSRYATVGLTAAICEPMKVRLGQSREVHLWSAQGQPLR